MSRALPVPPSSSDAGEPEPRVTAALAAYADDHRLRPQAVAALQTSRLLVPVVAIPGAVGQGTGDHGAQMASVLLTGADGRLALLAFTGLSALRAWDAEARPVPVPARRAAVSALQDGAAALLVDVAGPVTLAVEGADLAAVARGWALTRVGKELAWLDPVGSDSAGQAEIG